MFTPTQPTTRIHETWSLLKGKRESTSYGGTAINDFPDDSGNSENNGQDVQAWLAACYLRTAVIGLATRPLHHKTGLEDIMRMERFFSFRTRALTWTTFFSLCALVVVEDGTNPQWWTLVMETICCVILFALALEKRKFVGKTKTARTPHTMLHFALLILLLMDLITTMATSLGWRYDATADNNNTSIPPSSSPTRYRFARALRPFLAFEYAPLVRTRFFEVLNAGYAARSGVLILAFSVTLFSVSASVLFHNTEEGTLYFATFGDSLTTLIILLTTCNSPTVMTPAYFSDRASSLFFVAFLLVNYFLILKLVLGQVYFEQKQILKRSAASEILRERVATRMAFRTLQNTTTNVVEFDRLVSILAFAFKLDYKTCAEVVYSVGGSTEGGVNKTHFKYLPVAIRLVFAGFYPLQDEDDEDTTTIASNSWRAILRRAFVAPLPITTRLPETWIPQWTMVELAVITLLCASLGSVIMSWNKEWDVEIWSLQDMANVNATLALLFAMEMVLKVYAFGISRFIDDLWNVFDLVCVVTSCGGVILLLGGIGPSHIARLFVNVQLLRLVRVVPSFRMLFEITTTFVPEASPFFWVFVLSFYSVAIFTVGAFGHIRLSNDNYVANDFRDFPSALLTLFELAVVNDWNRTMASFVEATGTKTIRIFFISWWVFSVLLLTNVTTALILDAFERELGQQISGGHKEQGTTRVLTRFNVETPVIMNGAPPPPSPSLRRQRTLSRQSSFTSFTLGSMLAKLTLNVEEPSETLVSDLSTQCMMEVIESDTIS